MFSNVRAKISICQILFFDLHQTGVEASQNWEELEFHEKVLGELKLTKVLVCVALQSKLSILV